MLFEMNDSYTWANACMQKIKRAPFFPVRTGFLRDSATYLRINSSNSTSIVFQGAFAPYIFALEEGSKPHDIPNAFGNGPDFGIGGRFDGKFHPGSYNHQGFISRDAYSMAINIVRERVARKYNIVSEGFAKEG